MTIWDYVLVVVCHGNHILVDYVEELDHSRLSLLNRISLFLPTPVLLRIYKQTILPILDYCSNVWHDCGSTLTKKVELVQNRVMRIILKVGRKTCTQEMRKKIFNFI